MNNDTAFRDPPAAGTEAELLLAALDDPQPSPGSAAVSTRPGCGQRSARPRSPSAACSSTWRWSRINLSVKMSGGDLGPPFAAVDWDADRLGVAHATATRRKSCSHVAGGISGPRAGGRGADSRGPGSAGPRLRRERGARNLRRRWLT